MISRVTPGQSPLHDSSLHYFLIGFRVGFRVGVGVGFRVGFRVRVRETSPIS